MKKLLSFLMACSMLLALGAGAFADDENPGDENPETQLVDNELVKFTVDTKTVVICSDSSEDVEIAITPSDYTGDGIDGAILNVTYNSSDIEYIADSDGNPIVEWNKTAFENLMGGASGSSGSLTLTFGSSAVAKPTTWLVKLHFKVITNDVKKVHTTLPISGKVTYVTAANTLKEGGDLVPGGIKVAAAQAHQTNDPNKPVGKDVPAPSNAKADGVILYEPGKEPTLFADGHRPYYYMKDPDAPAADEPGLIYWDESPTKHMDDPTWLAQHMINPLDDAGETDPYSYDDIKNNKDGQWVRNKVPSEGADKGDATKGWPDKLTLKDDEGNDVNTLKQLVYMIGDTTNDRKIDLRDFNAFSRFINKVPETQQKSILTNITNPEADGMPFWNINAVGCSYKTSTHQTAGAWTINSVPTASAAQALFGSIAYGTEMVTEYSNHTDILNNVADLLVVSTSN